MYAKRNTKASRCRGPGGAGTPGSLCYVRPAVTGSPGNLRASAMVAATALAVAACGENGGDADRAGEAANVEVQRIAFPARQHVGESSTLAMTVRNAGDTRIRDLVVVLRGFSSGTDQKPQRPLWLVDEPPAGSGTSLADTYATGPLAAGRRRTLRWRVTAVLPGAHSVTYSVGRRARGTLRARVSERPPFSRVDPRTGAVIRE